MEQQEVKSYCSENILFPGQATEISFWERFGTTASLDVKANSFSWNMLSSVHRTESSCNIDMNKALESTVDFDGVIFFALFNVPPVDSNTSKQEQTAAVIKIASSRIATQSEQLGYEFSKWLGVETPQARIIHSSNSEWLQIKEAAERARDVAIKIGDEVGELTCSELLEALELTCCIFLMSYVHGCPLLETSTAFDTDEAADRTAAALGRILMLDLVIRNEDRLPSRQLRWRGNNANLLIADKMAPASACKDTLKEAVDSRLIKFSSGVASKNFALSDAKESSKFHIIATGSGVPRRPPVGKRSEDKALYPKLVELMLNCSAYSSKLLHDITGGKLGFSESAHCDANELLIAQKNSPVREFRKGFRSAFRDLQGLHIFLVKLHRKLDSLLQSFMNITNTKVDFEKDDMMIPELSSPPNKEKKSWKSRLDINDSEIEQWENMLKTEVLKLCQDNNFNSGFFEESGSNKIADVYELKLKLEHVLERISFISDAGNSARPSFVINGIFIGDFVAARSLHTLQHLGITHVLCLCSDQLGQLESQHPEIFEYKNFLIKDTEDADISSILTEGCDFIDYVQETGGKVLVHCFEGISRSATLVLAYLMLRKRYTLHEAWNILKKVHRRAQPNDGFAKTLIEVDKNVHGKVSMEWRQRKKVCSICGKVIGFSTISLKLHFQKVHMMSELGQR